MKEYVLVINSGSSSLKFQLFEKNALYPLTKGIIDRIGFDKSQLHMTVCAKKETRDVFVPNHQIAVQVLIRELLEYDILEDLDQIKGVGHRVAHGGETFLHPVVITKNVEEEIEKLSELAPLHNPINLIGIRAFRKALPEAIQIAVFDTSYHQTMEEKYYTYPIPIEYRDSYKIRRYGFHGISHEYISRELLRKCKQSGKVISAHLGNGSSICAILDGKSVINSMGFTPTAGLMMGTRCGDLDPSILTFIEKHDQRNSDEIEWLLNHSSGLKGIYKYSSDMRDIEDACSHGDERACLALEIFITRVVEKIGSYVAILNGLDCLVFTAGIGEHSSLIRSKVCQQFEFLGLKIDERANKENSYCISTKNSTIKVLVVQTNEELLISEAVWAYLT